MSKTANEIRAWLEDDATWETDLDGLDHIDFAYAVLDKVEPMLALHDELVAACEAARERMTYYDDGDVIQLLDAVLAKAKAAKEKP